MAAEILFGAIILIAIFLFNRQFNELTEYFGSPVYFCWFLLAVSMFDYTPSSVQYALRAAAIVISVICIVRDGGKIYFVRCPIIVFLLLYLALCGLSTLYSVNKVQTFIKVVELAIDIFLIMAAMSVEESYEIAIKKFIQVIFIMLVLIEVYVLVGMALMPSTFIKTSSGVFGFQLTGGILSSNSIGAASMFIVIYLLNINSMRFKYPILGMALVELLLSQARTSFVSLAIILAIYFFRTKRKGIYFIAITIGGILIYLNSDAVINYLLRGADSNNLETMSGRTTMWAEAMEMIRLKPWFGYGFGSGGEMISKLHNNMSSLHSGIYETLIGVGVVGFTMLLIIYVVGCILLVRSILRDGLQRNGFEIMFWVDISIRTYMSTGIGGWQGYGIMMWYVLLFALSFNSEIGSVTDILNNESYGILKAEGES